MARGPARCWPWAQAMDVLDLAPYLCVGANQIALQVYSPGYSHFAYVPVSYTHLDVYKRQPSCWTAAITPMTNG